MHASKHETLAAISSNAWPIFHRAAVANRVSVDDVVSAGLRRLGAAPAKLAADQVEKDLPGIFDLLTNWPYTCPFCLGQLAPKDVASCAHCKSIGCSECVSGKGCPTCVAVYEAKRDAAVARARSSVAEVLATA